MQKKNRINHCIFLLSVLLAASAYTMDRQLTPTSLERIPVDLYPTIASHLISSANLDSFSQELENIHQLRCTSKKWRNELSRENMIRIWNERCSQAQLKTLMLEFLHIIPARLKIRAQKAINLETSHIHDDGTMCINEEGYLHQKFARYQISVITDHIGRFALLCASNKTFDALQESKTLLKKAHENFIDLTRPIFTAHGDTITKIISKSNTFKTITDEVESNEMPILLPEEIQSKNLAWYYPFLGHHAARGANNELFYCGLIKHADHTVDIFLAKYGGFLTLVKPEPATSVQWTRMIPMPGNTILLAYLLIQEQDWMQGRRNQLICLQKFNTADGSPDITFGQKSKAYKRLATSFKGEPCIAATSKEIRMGSIQKDSITLIAHFDAFGRAQRPIAWPDFKPNQSNGISRQISSSGSSSSSDDSSSDDSDFYQGEDDPERPAMVEDL